MSSLPGNPEPDSPWLTIGGGVVLIILAFSTYYLFSSLEASHGSIRIHWLVVVIYMLIGKWGAVVTFGAIGLAALLAGIRRVLDE